MAVVVLVVFLELLGVAGTDNLGGGGGGANQTEASGKGGSGVVILSVPTEVILGQQQVAQQLQQVESDYY